MLESLIADKSGGKKTLRKDIDVQHLMAIDSFHKSSFFWSYLLSYNGLCSRCVDGLYISELFIVRCGKIIKQLSTQHVSVIGVDYVGASWLEHPLPSNRQHLSYDVCLEVRGEIIRTVLCCIVY